MTQPSTLGEVRRVVVGTAGHIDHGKTALVRALTGIDADRLKEEKERGITIDIGFANLTVGNVRFGFVDVPGHERFVKNMLAGVHGVDMVILVVAADESLMPQTREHFDICKFLRVPRGLVAITKSDLVDEDLVELVKSEVQDFASGSFLEGAPIVPVSSKTGYGIERLKNELVRLASGIPTRDSGRTPRMPIDRVFSAKGFGTIVTGTLISGSIDIGQNLEILPQRLPTSVRGIQVYGATVTEAQAGERVAVNLQNVTVDRLQRGDILASPDRLRPTSIVDVRLELLPSAPQTLTNRARVRLHHGASELLARAILLDRSELKPGESGLVQFRLERPSAFSIGDRFIIRRYSPQVTSGGGEIVDPAPEKHRAYSPNRADSRRLAAWIEDLASSTIDRKLQLWIEACGERGMGITQLVWRSGLNDTRLKTEVGGLISHGAVVEIAGRTPRYISAGVVLGIKQRMVDLLQTYHRDAPLSDGIPREELRNRLLGRVEGETSVAIFNYLCGLPGFAVDRDLIRLASHSVNLNEEEAILESRILEDLRNQGLQPLAPEDLLDRLRIDPSLGKRLLNLLLKQGETIRIGEYYFAKSAIDALIKRLREQKLAEPTLDISRFKALSGLTRKFAIPLLEYLDRIRVTRRLGDIRQVL